MNWRGLRRHCELPPPGPEANRDHRHLWDFWIEPAADQIATLRAKLSRQALIDELALLRQARQNPDAILPRIAELIIVLDTGMPAREMNEETRRIAKGLDALHPKA